MVAGVVVLVMFEIMVGERAHSGVFPDGYTYSQGDGYE
jgi:hypothetical protein